MLERYSTKSLRNEDTDANGRRRVIIMQPYKGRWIVEQNAEAMGSIRKRKAKGQVGWDLDPWYGDKPGRWKDACELAANLLDAHFKEVGGTP